MGTFRVDAASKPGFVMVELNGPVSSAEMRACCEAFNAAVDALRGAPYRVFCDFRNVPPLSPEAAEVLAAGKGYSGKQPNFLGSAVLVASSVMAMQHRRTGLDAGIVETELVSDDEAACWEFLKTVARVKR